MSLSEKAWQELEAAAMAASGLCRVEYRLLPQHERARLRLEVQGKLKTSHTFRNPAQYVYFLTNKAFPGYLKVGQSLDIQNRLNVYQSGCPHFAYRMPTAHFVPNASLVTATIYLALQEYRALGEWFCVDLDTANKILEQIIKES